MKRGKLLLLFYGIVFAVLQVQANTKITFNPFKAEFNEISPGIWTSIRNNPHLHPVMGNSVFIIGEKGVVVFDGGGVAIMADQLISKIRSLTKLPVTHVAISHWHGDHNFGVYRFAEEYPDVEFVTQQFTDRALRSEKMNYLENYPNYLEKTIPRIEKRLAETQWDDKGAAGQYEKAEYQRILEYKDIVAKEFKRAKIQMATLIFNEKLVIMQGNREIHLLHIGHGNTEGDIIMWLPKERIVATGDLVVLPTPYAFNVPPKAWAKTLKALNGLEYEILVPGHGEVQSDTKYVDLLIEVATHVVEQRDTLLAKGMPEDEIIKQIDLSIFLQRFIGEEESLSNFYQGYFVEPLLTSAIKELRGIPMVELIPKKP
jgi:glyoxylase-like metal-dependent hydrolase (beta-lactamase superfamily II)